MEPGDALTIVDWGSTPSFYAQTRAACLDVDVVGLPPAPDGGPGLVTNAGRCSITGTSSPLELGGNCSSQYHDPG